MPEQIFKIFVFTAWSDEIFSFHHQWLKTFRFVRFRSCFVNLRIMTCCPSPSQYNQREKYRLLPKRAEFSFINVYGGQKTWGNIVAAKPLMVTTR